MSLFNSLERIEFPHNESKRIEALASGLSNELKAVLLLHAEREWFFLPRIKEEIEKSIDRPMRFKNLSEAGFSLYASGLLSRSNLFSQRGYSLTIEGASFGREAAALVLESSVRSNKSVFEIFGKCRRKNRYIRSRVLEVLTERGGKRDECFKSEGFSSSLLKETLESLSQEGLVEYIPVLDKRYEWVGGKSYEGVGNGRGPLSLSRDIAFEIKKRGVAERDEIADRFSVSLSVVSSVLSDLRRKGFVRKRRVYDNAKASKKGGELLENFVYPLRRICSGESIFGEREIERIRIDYSEKALRHYEVLWKS